MNVMHVLGATYCDKFLLSDIERIILISHVTLVKWHLG